MQKLYGWQTELLQGNSENMNRISSVDQKKKTSDINVCNGENSGNDHSFVKSSTISGTASEDELLNYTMKANNSPVKEEKSDAEKEKEKSIFDKFLREVRCYKPEPIRCWSGLQHYVYYVYRQFLSTRPSNINELFPATFIKKFRELMEFLLGEDRTQLYLRLLALLREFAYVGKECYKHSSITKIPANLVNLMAYYSAFCSAADKLSPLVPEVDILLMERFQVNWLCLNKSIFYHYIYMDECVQTKLPAFAKLQSENKSFHKKIIDSYECFKEDMALLASRWNNITLCISILSKKAALENPAVKLTTDYMSYQEDTKILKSNYWIIRTEKQKKLQEQSELDAHLLALVGNLGQMCDAIIDKIGHCVCDDCLSDEFTKVIYNREPDTDQSIRRISCYICRDIIPLETFVHHLVIKHQSSPPVGVKYQERKFKTARRTAKSSKPKEEGEFPEVVIDLETRRVRTDDKDDPSRPSFVLDEAALMQMMHFTLCRQLAFDPAAHGRYLAEECKPPAPPPTPPPGQSAITVEQFDKQAEKLFTEFLRKKAGLTQSQVEEVCRQGAERVAQKKAAEKKEREMAKEKEKEKSSSENKEKPAEEKAAKDKKAAKLETIEKKIAAIAAQRKVAVMAAAAAAEKKAAAKAIEERAAEKKMIEKKLLERKPAEGKERDGNKKESPKQDVSKNNDKKSPESSKKEKDGNKKDSPKQDVLKNGEKKSTENLKKDKNKKESPKQDVSKNGEKQSTENLKKEKDKNKKESPKQDVSKNGEKQPTENLKKEKDKNKKESPKQDVLKNIEKQPAESVKREKEGNKKELPKQDVLKNNEKISVENLKKEKEVNKKESQKQDVLKNGEKKPTENLKKEKEGNKKESSKQDVVKHCDKKSTEYLKKDYCCDAKKEEALHNIITRNRNLSAIAKEQSDVKKANAPPPVPKTTCTQASSHCNGAVSKPNHQDAACNHTCNSKEEVEATGCCNHNKEVLKKCDCPYCEILGTTAPPIPWQKNNETRDRLRSRLHQRKERDSKGSDKLNGHKTTAEQLLESTKFLRKDGEANAASSSSDFKLVNSRVPIIPDHVNASKPSSNGTNSPKNGCAHQKASRYQKQSFVESVTKSLNSLDTALPTPTSSGLNIQPKAPSEQVSITGSISSLSSSLSSLQDNGDSRDINELLNFIEGNKKKDQLALAEKKSAKKARQKKKREDEKKRMELEARRKEQERIREERRKEEKIREEKRKLEKQALEAKQQMLQSSQKKDTKQVLQPRVEQQKDVNTNTKKKDKKSKDRKETKKQIEETIPAMVTIKRVPENGSAAPTVTITLKGSTPDQDRLLYTLVNGQTKESAAAKAEKNGKKSKTEIKIKPQQVANNISNNKKKIESKKLGKENRKGSAPPPNELKVTLSIEKNNASSSSAGPEEKEKNKKGSKYKKQPKMKNMSNNKGNDKEEKSAKPPKGTTTKIYTNKNRDDHVDLPMLRLPPGITITKIDGPAVNRNFKNISSMRDGNVNPKFSSSLGSNVAGNKSGVIVVDTEKLIQQSFLANESKKLKKKNKKANKNGNVTASTSTSINSNGYPSAPPSISIESVPDHPKENSSSMVTLKNPIFHSLQSTLANKNDKLELHAFPSNQQASIIKNENGMVTIRRPRLQQFEGGSCLSNILSDLKPVMETGNTNTVPTPTPSTSSSSLFSCWNQHDDTEIKSPFNAQAILSGLPGIEITKIDKNSIKSDYDLRKNNNNQLADVSIIPTGSKLAPIGVPRSDRPHHGRPEWFDNIFTPREVSEEDLVDAADRDIEAFKRFCHQSVMPEHKEKVAHLNVQNIVFQNNSDLSFFS